MATSPGRSAIQAKPEAMTAIETRKRMIRIIPTSLLAKRVSGVARKPTRRSERSLPCLSFSDPTQCGRSRCRVELPEINECVVDGRVRGFFLDAHQYGSSIVTCGGIDRTDPHEPGGTRLETLQIAASRHLTTGCLHHSRKQRA